MLVGANRDEKYNRYSEDFAFRPDGVCCPLDVRGGTWIGINDRFVFAALTNLEVPRGDKMGRRSRGDLIFQALKQSNALTAAGKVLELLGSGSYNPCNIFIADNTRLLGITVTEPKIQIAQLSPQRLWTKNTYRYSLGNRHLARTSLSKNQRNSYRRDRAA